ncbi:hypothetical protein CKF59_00230, partial [Psittacicella gerlachiana]
MVTLVACSNTMPELTNQPVEITPGTQHISFAQNQQELKRIQALDLRGQVGMITAKERSSTTFTFQYLVNNDYIISLNIPYTARVAKLQKVGARYYYSEDNNTYSSSSAQEFSKALFGFSVPLEVLNKIVLGIPLETGDKSTAVISGNVIVSQVYNGDTYITYGDFRYLDNKYIVPYAINIRRGT